jgi:hypothetical protein
MAIPEFAEDGSLPVGCHLCIWEELVERFGAGARRQDLVQVLKGFIDVARDCGFAAVAVGGSFASAKDSPADLDMLFVHQRNLDKSTLSVTCAQLLVNDTAFQTRTGHNAQSCADEPDVVASMVSLLGYDYKTGKDRGIIMVRLR